MTIHANASVPDLATALATMQPGESVAYGGQTVEYLREEDYNPRRWRAGGTVWFCAEDAAHDLHLRAAHH